MATVPRGSVGKLRFGPSDRLFAMFRSCSRDPTEAVKTRLRGMLHLFLQHHRDDEGRGRTKVLAVKCCCEAGAWYYRILEKLLIQERKRLGISDVSDILENDLLQSCLVACCLEISVTSNRLSCDFPMLLQLLNLAPYQFWKVIEPVLRVGVGLPGLVVRHLTQVEENILESLAWTSYSPLWEEIRANEGHMPACQQVMLPTQLEDSTGTDLHSLSTLNRQRGSSFHLFSRKVYSLMGLRLRELCSMLDISAELRLKIWTCFEYSLLHCTSLMVDRHLDQLLMCAIYIIAKISRMEISFKRIMKCYESQPHTSKSVCKNVLISVRDVILTPSTPSAHYPGHCQEKRGNLIYFYNQTYTTKMQHFAKQFTPSSGGDTPPLSPYPQLKKAAPCRQQLPCSPTVFIAPYKAETTEPFPSRLCYYFSSSSSERLREINNMIRTGSPPKSCYALSMDADDGEDEDGPSAKRLRSNSQSAWQRRLRNVLNDRITRQNQEQV